MREDLNDLLAGPSCDVVKCLLFPPYFLSRHDVLWCYAVRSLASICTSAIPVLRVWVAVKEVLSLGLVIRISMELTTRLAGCIHCSSPGASRDKIGMLPY